MIRTGMLLAAGLGTRLRPLTEKTPKPMLPLDGHPLIDHSLGLLQRAGIHHVVINLHYLGEQIRDYCKDGRQWGMHIDYSEELVILGSGGGLKQAETFFGSKPVVAINADTLLDIDLALLISKFNPEHDGLMVTVPVSEQDPYGRVTVDTSGHLRGFGSGDVTFAGVQIVTPRLLDHLPNGESSIIEKGYKPLIQEGGVIDAVLHNGYWNDIGTVARYENTCKEIQSGKLKLKPVQPV